jgi:predicted ArsR family transcriptional regulator
LNALKAEGLVTCAEMEQDGRPDKKVYSITKNGREAFRRALHREPAPDSFRSEAIFMMFFGHLLDRTQLRHVYQDYVARYRARLERMEQQDMTDSPAGRRFVHGMGLAVYRANLAYMEQNQDLLFAARNEGDPLHEDLPQATPGGQHAAE